MEKFPIGYIFTSAVVIDVSPYKDTFFLESNVNGNIYCLRLFNNYIPYQPKKNKWLNNLVVIGYAKRGQYKVAYENYWSKMIELYYKGKHSSMNAYWGKLYERWTTECGKDFKNSFKIQKVNPIIDEKSISLYALRGKDYLLPVWGCRNLDHLEGSYLFYPHVASKICVYKIDTNDPSDFPKYYETKIKVDDRSEDQVAHIYFHGFCYPVKWHHCIWKHVFALTKTATKGENLLWEKYWDIKTSPRTIFEKCRENDEDKSCNSEHCISNKLFKNVHINIKEKCKKFFENIVTSFESNTTKYIVVRNTKDNTAYKKITILFRKKIDIIERQDTSLFGSTITIAKKQEVYQYAILTGISYNWKHTTPVLHIFPQTMYLDVCRKGRWWVNKEVKKDKGNVIFTGKFSEVK